MRDSCETPGDLSNFGAFADDMPVPVYLVTTSAEDPVGTFTYANAAARVTLGIVPGTSHATLWQRVRPEDLPRYLAVYERDSGPESEVSQSLRIWTTEDRWRAVDVHAARKWVGPDGATWRHVVVDTADPAASEEGLERTRALYRSVVENVPVPVTVYATDGMGFASHVGYANPAAVAAFGVVAGQTIDDMLARIHPDDLGSFVAENDRTNRSGEPFDLVFRVRDTKDRWRWIRGHATLARDAQGLPLAWHVAEHDLTELIEAQRALASSEERYRRFVEDLPVAAYAIEAGSDGAPGRTIVANRKLQELFGDPAFGDAEERLARIHPDDRAAFVEARSAAVRTGGLTHTMRILNRDDQWRTVEARISLVLDADGHPLAWQGIVTDVTEQADAERRLAKSEENYRNLVENLPIGLTINRLDPVAGIGHFVYANPVAGSLMGIHSGDSRDSFVQRIHPDDMDQFLQEDRRTDETGDPFAMRLRVHSADGWRWLDTRAVLIKESDGTLTWEGFIDDVTTAEEGRRSLEQSEARYRRLVEGLPIGLTILEARDDLSAGALLYANPVAESFLGVGPGADHAAFLRSQVHPDDVPRYQEAWKRSISTGEPFALEYRVRNGAGEWRWIEAHAFLMAAPAGEGIAWWGFGLDVTERAVAQQALSEGEARYRSLLDSLPVGIFTAPRLGDEPSYANASYRALVPPGPTDWGRWVHPDDLPAVQAAIEESKRRRDAVHLTFRTLRPDSEVGWIEVHAEPVYVGDEASMWQGYVSDVTERVRAEEARIRAAEERAVEEHQRRAQRMEAVGRLAGGVAHDFNNLLTAITGFAEMLRDEIPVDDPRHSYAASVLSAAEQATFVTRRLLAFSRRDITVASRIEADGVVRNLDQIMRRIIGEDITLLLDLDESPLPIRADRGQIEQVLINLLVNARDAMPEGGIIRVSARRGDLPQAFGPGKSGCRVWLHLAVSDDGLGMDERTRARAFEPYFTTKGQGGTGLGLAIVYGAVQQSGGHVEIESAPGAGTTVDIYFPLLDDAESGPLGEDLHAHPPARNDIPRLLVVEDEDAVRSYAREVAQRLGYDVTVAADAEEALRLVTAEGRAFEVLLTDVVMPGMSGRALAEALSPRLPGLATVYMSGHTDDAIVRRGIQQDDVVFLPKPFRAKALEDKLGEALDRARRLS